MKSAKSKIKIPKSKITRLISNQNNPINFPMPLKLVNAEKPIYNVKHVTAEPRWSSKLIGTGTPRWSSKLIWVNFSSAISKAALCSYRQCRKLTFLVAPKLTKHFIAALATLAAVCLSGVAGGSVMINEALVDPTAVSDTYGEWIELYNDSTGAVDINGWVLKDLGTNYHQISNLPSLIIPCQGYLVLGRSIDPAVNGGYTPDYVYSNFALNNTQDEILIGATAQTAVGISYDSATWPILAGRSVAYDTQGDITDASNWFATLAQSQYLYGEGDYGTPGAANIPSVPGPASIPEPGTVLLMVSGMVMLGKKLNRKVDKEENRRKIGTATIFL